jgi:protein SCO1/2
MNKFKLIITILIATTIGVASSLWYVNSKTDTPSLANKEGQLSFTLDSLGGKQSFSDSQGKLRIVYVGYMSCPDICPTSLSRISGALNLLSTSELSNVQPYFLSVDPKRDTPELLGQYTEYFHQKIIGLTGDKDSIDGVVNYLKAYYRMVPLKDSAFGYAVDHSANIYLLDGEGFLLETFPDTLSPTEMTQRIQHYLN